MTPAEVFEAANVRCGDAFAVVDTAVADWRFYQPAEQSRMATPAVFVELVAGSSTTTRGLNRITVRCNVIVDQLETGATNMQWLDAVGRLVAAWRTGPAQITVTGWSYRVVELDLGGVPHNGVAFDVNLEHAADAC